METLYTEYDLERRLASQPDQTESRAVQAVLSGHPRMVTFSELPLFDKARLLLCTGAGTLVGALVGFEIGSEFGGQIGAYACAAFLYSYYRDAYAKDFVEWEECNNPKCNNLIEPA